MTTLAEDARPLQAGMHHDRSFADPTEPEFSCFLSHFEALAERYTLLAAECRQVKADFADRIERGLTLNEQQFALAIRIACQIASEDVNNHPDPPRALEELAEAGDDLYIDALRLSGQMIWDEKE